MPRQSVRGLKATATLGADQNMTATTGIALNTIPVIAAKAASASSTGFVLSSEGARISVTPATSSWEAEVFLRLQYLINLEPGWDGYQGKPVLLQNACFAMSMLSVICGHNTRAPQAVPGPDGDLQLEWHTLRGDLELQVKGPNDVQARYSEVGDEVGAEANLTVDFTRVVTWVRHITDTQTV